MFVHVEKVVTGHLATNTYIVCSAEECVVVDPGGGADRILARLGGRSVAAVVAAWVGEVVNVVLYAMGGVLLVAMGAVLVVERLNRSFVIWASRFQTSAYKASKRGVGRAGDFMLGASLGAVWTPCIAPFFGAVVVANLVASALTGNYLLLFAATLAYAAGLALVIYLLIVAVRRGAGRAVKSMRWGSLGRRIEYAVGVASIILGVLLIGEAFGLGTFSALFKL